MFNSRILDEPSIEVANSTETKTPKRGLIESGAKVEGDEHTIKLGIVGSKKSGYACWNFFEETLGIIHPGDTSRKDVIDPSRIPFPGFENDELNINLSMRNDWLREIDEGAKESIKSKITDTEKIEELSMFIENEIEFLSNHPEPPTVVVVALPEEILSDIRKDKKNNKVRTDEIDLRSEIKISGMKNSIPTQLIQENNLRTRSEIQKAKRAWNLSLGLLYKSQKGHPWKTRELGQGECFVGLSFYRKNERYRVAVTNIFVQKDHTILQSDPIDNVIVDDNNSPHMKATDAQEVFQMVLDWYKEYTGNKPKRLVIHKTSHFRDEEKRGINKAANDVSIIDMVRIRDEKNMRIFPKGNFPPVRGTLLESNNNKGYLYTKGYIPTLAQYPNNFVPKPIEIMVDEDSYSNIRKIADEVMFLTKLDWNTSEFSVKNPVTINIANSVGKVFSDIDNYKKAKKQYYYYM